MSVVFLCWFIGFTLNLTRLKSSQILKAITQSSNLMSDLIYKQEISVVKSCQKVLKQRGGENILYFYWHLNCLYFGIRCYISKGHPQFGHVLIVSRIVPQQWLTVTCAWRSVGRFILCVGMGRAKEVTLVTGLPLFCPKGSCLSFQFCLLLNWPRSTNKSKNILGAMWSY